MRSNASRIICPFLVLSLLAGISARSYAQANPATGAGTQARRQPAASSEMQQPAFNLKEELEKERVVVKRSKYGMSRRDPFTNPLTKKKREGLSGPREVPEYMQPQLLSETKAQISNLKKLINEKDYEAALPLSAEIENTLTMVKWAPQFAEEAEKLKEQFARLKNIILAEQYKTIYEQSLKIVAEMNEAFAESEFEKVRQLHRSLEKIFSSFGKIDSGRFPLLEPLRLRAQKLVERAANKEKLLKTKLEIRGIVWTPDQRTALVNNLEVEEGEMLQDEIYIREIGEDFIVFEYKSETDKRTMLGY